MQNKSFTLIEILLVISIIALLTSIILLNMGGTREKARIAKAQSFADTIRAGLQDSIVGWWDFDEGSGNRASDSWGGNALSLMGGSWVTGVHGSSYQLNSGSVTTNFTKGIGNAVTYSFWFKLRGTDRTGTLICADDISVATREDNLGQTNYGDTSCGNGGPWTNSRFNISVADTKWHHFAITKSSSNSKLCLDGNCSLINNNISNMVPNIGRIRINTGCGCGYANFSQGMVIDELRIYSKAF